MGTNCSYYWKEIASKDVRWSFFSFKKWNVCHGLNGTVKISGRKGWFEALETTVHLFPGLLAVQRPETLNLATVYFWLTGGMNNTSWKPSCVPWFSADIMQCQAPHNACKGPPPRWSGPLSTSQHSSHNEAARCQSFSSCLSCFCLNLSSRLTFPTSPSTLYYTPLLQRAFVHSFAR